MKKMKRSKELLIYFFIVAAGFIAAGLKVISYVTHNDPSFVKSLQTAVFIVSALIAFMISLFMWGFVEYKPLKHASRLAAFIDELFVFAPIFLRYFVVIFLVLYGLSYLIIHLLGG